MSDNGNREKATWQGYVNFNPSDSERQAIKASLLTAAQAESFVLDLVGDGYKVEYYFDEYRESPVVAIYGYYADTPNAGKKLVIPHADPRVATSALAFFIREICENGKWPEQRSLDNPYDW